MIKKKFCISDQITGFYWVHPLKMEKVILEINLSEYSSGEMTSVLKVCYSELSKRFVLQFKHILSLY